MERRQGKQTLTKKWDVLRKRFGVITAEKGGRRGKRKGKEERSVLLRTESQSEI